MNVLLIRLSSLGDIVHALPALAALRGAQPDATIGWAVREDLAPLLRGHPMIDRLHAAPGSWWRGRWQGAAGRAAAKAFIDEVRAAGYPTAIDLMGTAKGARLAVLSGAEERLGPSTAKEGAGWFYTRSADVDPTAHAVDRYRAVVEAFASRPGSPVPNDEAPRFVFPDFAPQRARLAERLELVGLAARPWVVLHPGAGKEANLWPLAHWVELASLLRARGAGVVLTGSIAEAQRARAVSCDLNLAGALDLPSLAVLLAEADAVVAGDTGPLHLAAAQGTPVVGLYGAADPRGTGPYGWDRSDAGSAGGAAARFRVLRIAVPCGPCHAERCPLGTRECMAGIAPARVAEAVCELLPSAAAYAV